MFDKDKFLSSRSLTIQKVLQKTDIQTTDLLVDEGGDKLVLKVCHKKTKASEIEKNILRAIARVGFHELEMPQLIELGDDYLLMTYVEREDQTRDTITQRVWSNKDVELFCKGIFEFQAIKISPRWFSLKQRIIGLVYPPIKCLSLLPNFIAQKTISFIGLIKILGLASGYVLLRPLFNNVTVHYDLTTYNYAFSGQNKMSMLDFELAYYLGDPLFDVAYFVTIPPVSMDNWTFQNKVLSQYMKMYGSSFSSRLRLRLILLMCSMVRYEFFDEGTIERSNNLDTINKLLSGSWDESI